MLTWPINGTGIEEYIAERSVCAKETSKSTAEKNVDVAEKYYTALRRKQYRGEKVLHRVNFSVREHKISAWPAPAELRVVGKDLYRWPGGYHILLRSVLSIYIFKVYLARNAPHLEVNLATEWALIIWGPPEWKKYVPIALNSADAGYAEILHLCILNFMMCSTLSPQYYVALQRSIIYLYEIHLLVRDTFNSLRDIFSSLCDTFASLRDIYLNPRAISWPLSIPTEHYTHWN